MFEPDEYLAIYNEAMKKQAPALKGEGLKIVKRVESVAGEFDNGRVAGHP